MPEKQEAQSKEGHVSKGSLMQRYALTKDTLSTRDYVVLITLVLGPAAALLAYITVRERRGRRVAWGFSSPDRGEQQSVLDHDHARLKQLRKALLSAFPTYQDLDMMVFDQLCEHLSAITRGSTLEHTIFELIQWAVANGRLEELVIAALRQNGHNLQLIRVAKQLGVKAQSNYISLL